MGLIGSFIVGACLSAGSVLTDQQACEKAVEAGARQIGLYDSIDFFETKTVSSVTRVAEEKIGKDAVWSVTGTAFLIRTLSSKSLVFGLPTYGLCNSVRTEIKPEQSLLVFEWKF